MKNDCSYDNINEEAIDTHYVNHRNAINSYSNITAEEWYYATGELAKSGEKIIYPNEYGGEWIIEIK